MKAFLSFLVTVATLSCCLSAAEMPARFPDRGLWGINVHTPFHDRILKDCAVQWVRIGDRWNTGEPEKGKYDFASIRKMIEYYKSHDVNMIVVLDTETMNPHYANADLDTLIEALSNWHAAIAAEFKGVSGIIWEIGNEPEVFTMGGLWNNAKNYTRLAVATARKIKAADPAALVGAGSVAWVDRAFIDTALHEGLLAEGTIDFFTYHGYHRTGMAPESGLAADVEWMRSMIAKYAPAGHQVDIIDSERGYGILEKGKEKHRDNWRNHTQNETEQAAYLARHFLEEIHLGIEVSIWYKDLFGEDSFSLYYADENSGLRPCGKAYRNLAHLMPQNPRLIRNDDIQVRMGFVPMDIPAEQQPYLRSYLIRSENQSRLIVASWFPVEAFDGKIIDSRTVLSDGTMQERWRDVTPDDRVSLPVDIFIDLPETAVKSVSVFNLLADQPNSMTRASNVDFSDSVLKLKQVVLTSMPTIWVIDFDK